MSELSYRQQRNTKLRGMWIKDNLKRFQRAKTEKQWLAALNRAYDETVYHQIICVLEDKAA